MPSMIIAKHIAEQLIALNGGEDLEIITYCGSRLRLRKRRVVVNSQVRFPFIHVHLFIDEDGGLWAIEYIPPSTGGGVGEFWDVNDEGSRVSMNKTQEKVRPDGRVDYVPARSISGLVVFALVAAVFTMWLGAPASGADSCQAQRYKKHPMNADALERCLARCERKPW
jgi:hypothetical protein